MIKIYLTDNLCKGRGQLFEKKDIATLYDYANVPISELCAKHKNLLVFPRDINNSEDNLGGDILFKIEEESGGKVRFITGNVMGFIGVNNIQIDIKSRFDLGNDNYFLQYMLSKVLSFNLFDLNHSNKEDELFDILMCIFPHFLRQALTQGLYREYHRFNYNNANVKGTINIARHIKYNCPFNGKIAYTTRDYSIDNDMTQLIRHTIEFMKSRKYGNEVLNGNKDIIQNVKIIIDSTPSYSKNARRRIVNNNLRSKTHPYYTNYIQLRKLCIQILRMERMRYGEDENTLSGILFDGAWLWEEYVNTILCKLDFLHPRNKKGINAIYIFEDNNADGTLSYGRKMYPDFYKDNIVLDAKYKRLGSNYKVAEVDREDLYQIITYMFRLKARNGGFICPVNESEFKIPSSKIISSDSYVSILGLLVCQNAASYDDFCRQMEINESRFIDGLMDLLQHQSSNVSNQ